MSLVYQVRSWQQFENHRSREIGRCRWVMVPNKLDGLGLNWLLQEPDGAALLGIHHLILCLASGQFFPVDTKTKKPPPDPETGKPLERAGWLTENGRESGRPYTAADLAIRFHRPVAEVQRALDVLSSERVGWLIAHGKEGQQPPAPATPCVESAEPTRGSAGETPELRGEAPEMRGRSGSRTGTETETGPKGGRLENQGHPTSTSTATAGATRPDGVPAPQTNGTDGNGSNGGNGNGHDAPARQQATPPPFPVPTARRTEIPPGRATGAQTRAPWDTAGELLRRWGWGEEFTRRMLKWLARYRGGAWARAAGVEDWWRVLGLAVQTQRRQASRQRLPVQSTVSYWITLVDEGREPGAEDHKAARGAWEQIEAQAAPASEPPAWLAELFADVGKSVPQAPAAGYERINQCKALFGVGVKGAGR